MRRVWAPKVHPPELSQPGRRGHDYAERQRDGTEPNDEFPPHWRSADVRGVLRARCGAACAYCLDIVGRPGEDVEHFRPKNLYWFLAYTPGNYLSSCRRCNSSRKVNRFPLVEGSVRATQASELNKERRMLLDPARDDVERVLQIELGSHEYNWMVVPGASTTLRTRAAHTIEFFKLNTDTELRRARIEAIQQFFEEVLSGVPVFVQRARRRISRYTQHGAAVRSVALQQHPALVPDHVEELQWHITELVTLLELALQPGGEPEVVEMLQYALATIRVDPPRPITRTQVAAWYDAIQIGGTALSTRITPFARDLR
jgi:uncharacterized protein (TIGR02646 family)